MELTCQPRPNRYSNGITRNFRWQYSDYCLHVYSFCQAHDMKNHKLRSLSNERCLQFIGHSIDEISHFSSFRHYLRPLELRVRRTVGRNYRPSVKLSYPSESPCVTDSESYTNLIVAQSTRELQPDFLPILPLPKLEKLTAPNFRLNKDGVTDESSLANAPAPCCFPPIYSMPKRQ